MTDTTPSRATVVTFFEDRAQVTRRATVTVSSGRSDIRISGISVLVDDSTLIARTADGSDARVLTSRVHRSMRSVPTASEAEIDRLEKERDAAARAHETARRELQRAEIARRSAQTLDGNTLEAMRDVPAGDRTAASHWREALKRLDDEAHQAHERYADASERAADTLRDFQRADARLELARRKEPEISAAVELQLDARTASAVEIELEYYVPCALWRPSHIARLVDDDRAIDLSMNATVWQRTGEDWTDVECRFSTARPTRAAEAPKLADDLLRSRPKTDYERQVVQVEARDVNIASTGSELKGATDQMPGVDDGGEPLTLKASENVTIPSTGEPFRVEFARHRVECSTGLVAFPERSTVPFLRARGTWSGEKPVLAGPVVVMRGNEYAGRSRIDFVGTGETFELGFGVEGGVSIHRTLDDEHKTTAVTGKNVLHRTIKVFVSNLSSETRHLNIVERVPVSEIEEVQVKKVEAAVEPDEDGFVEFAVELEPRAVETLEIGYRVEYGSKVRLSW